MFDSSDIRLSRAFTSENEREHNLRIEENIDRELSIPMPPRRLGEETGVAIKEEEGATYEFEVYCTKNSRPVEYVQWMGRVIEMQDERFVAKIEAIKGTMRPKIVTFNTLKSCIFNREYMEEGATFVWTIGLFPKSRFDKTLVKRSEIRFRLIQDLDADYFDAYAMEKSRELLESISWLE